MSLTAAIEEAYAANLAGEVIIETVEFDHVTFDQPIRIACNVHDDVALPPSEGAAVVMFKALAVSVTLPGVGDDGPTPMRLRLDNVSSYLLPYVRAAVQSTQPVTVIYRAFTTSDLSKPGDIIPGLELRDVSLSPVSAEGSVSYREIELQAFPRATYDQEYYPALQKE